MATVKTNESAQFLLMSVGLYQNRGCEAIVRGTMDVLRHEFGATVQAMAGIVSGSPDAVESQIRQETDAGVKGFHVHHPGGPRWSPGWWAAKLNERFGSAIQVNLGDIRRQSQAACLALQVGGDTYSLDYGRPTFYLMMDRFLQSCGLPVVLWGATVGPFDRDPVFAPKMFEHLRTLKAIFVREADSYEYLLANGVSSNLYLMADPAFVMKPVPPIPERIGFDLPEGAIGINVSPMVAYYRGQKPAAVDLNEWRLFCVELVKGAAAFNRPILLVPHVATANGRDDFGLLDSVCRVVAGQVPVQVQVVPAGLTAAELKSIIARCAVFAGARTHSTIASLSSRVPTLSISYSAKAKGINRDVFGHLEHCIDVAHLTKENFVEGLRKLLEAGPAIRAHLESRIPELQARAFQAGATLRKICTSLDQNAHHR